MTARIRAVPHTWEAMAVHMKDAIILSAPHTRYFTVGTYAIAAVMYLLSLPHLPTLTIQLSTALLVIAFCVLRSLQSRIQNPERNSYWYFTAQAVLVTLMLVLGGSATEFFTFLFFLLTIEVAAAYPIRAAAAFIVLFWLIAGSVNVIDRGAASAVIIIFDTAVFLMCGVFGQSLRQAEVARRENEMLLEELRQTQQQVQELTLAEERNRMAREIHDGLGHYLTATAMQIQAAKALLESSGGGEPSPAAVGALGKAESLLQEALSDVRRSVAALRTAPADARPLPETLAEVVDDFCAMAALDVQLTTVGAPRPLSSVIDFTLYRALQEALTNVGKHAQATHVAVVLRYDSGGVHLEVRDNGRGRGDATGGFGLLGLRERVHLLGGTVVTRSVPGQGFCLEVEIPA